MVEQKQGMEIPKQVLVPQPAKESLEQEEGNAGYDL
jgi:hypothetical protein